MGLFRKVRTRGREFRMVMRQGPGGVRVAVTSGSDRAGRVGVTLTAQNT